MTTNTNHISICSVSDLVKKLGLSRARFYQLQKTGIFPEPVYCLYTRRPFYPIDLQERCLEIRKTGIGNNGRPIIFYNTKKTEVVAKSKDSCDPRYTELSEALEQTGLKISPSKVRKAIVALYPDNWQKLEIDGKVIAAVFRYFRNGV
jgi:hypothetical protein